MQCAAIPYALAGRDVIGLAETGYNVQKFFLSFAAFFAIHPFFLVEIF